MHPRAGLRMRLECKTLDRTACQRGVNGAGLLGPIHDDLRRPRIDWRCFGSVAREHVIDAKLEDSPLQTDEQYVLHESIVDSRAVLRSAVRLYVHRAHGQVTVLPRLA